MLITKTYIEGLFVIQHDEFFDERGSFCETYNLSKIESTIHNLYFNKERFVQDNVSVSKKGVLRGLHKQSGNFEQKKLVSVLQGEVYDVAVDTRPNSKTYGKYFGIFLSANNRKQLYIPEGFLHGFLAITDNVIFYYKCSNYYNKDSEQGVIYNDPTLQISWPIYLVDNVIVSEKDLKWDSFEKLTNTAIQ